MFGANSSPIRIIENFLPKHLLDGSIELLQNSEGRKHVFDLTASSSNQYGSRHIAECAQYASHVLNLEFNFAILKWYKLDEAHQSGAYHPHQDPPELRSIPLVILNLAGQATLDYWDADGEKKSHLYGANQCLLMAPDTVHSVSEPTTRSGTRFMLFLGYRKRQR